MTLPAALAVSVGPAIAKAILKVWLKDKTFLESVGESITEFAQAIGSALSPDGRPFLTRQQGQRMIGQRYQRTRTLLQ